MTNEVKLRPGWLKRDTQRAAERVAYWRSERMTDQAEAQAALDAVREARQALVPAPVLGASLPGLLVLLFGWLGTKIILLRAWWAVKRRPLNIPCVNGGHRATCPYRKDCWCGG